jgi:signal transduction histidine kinase
LETEEGTLIVSAVRDITEQRRYDRQLEVAAAEAEAASRAKSLVLSTVSHEIRTPMNAILGHAQLMSRDPELGANAKANLKIICQSGEHLITLITDILDMSKIEAGRTELNPTTFHFSRLVDNLASMFRLWAQAKALRFEVDEGKIRQVLINLLGNAIKFTARGQVTLHITLERRDAHRLWLSAQVEDTGPGIADDQQGKLFRPFSQIKRGIEEQEGTGLGLAIGRSYARLMGGDITVTSRLGQGSTFRFEMPIEPDQAIAGDQAMDGVVQSAPRESHADAVKQLYPAVALPPAVSSEQLSKLPWELIHQLQDAVQKGEKDRLDHLVQRVEEYDKQAARALEEFAENYQYDDLTHLLAETKLKLEP